MPTRLRRLQDAALVELIVERHHGYERRSLPYIVPLLARVAACHRRRNAKLDALCDAGNELAEAVEAQLDLEERELFPALLARPPRRELRCALEQLARHHRDVGGLLARMRSLGDGWAVPEWGSRSYRVLMEELEALEDDVIEHVHLESYALVQRLSPLAEAA